ncbi:MAG: aminoacyl-tRNA hydrolase [Patescibacteria group bacterium]|jgi:PTH1 family peptidyl-tRNA hydrolase
MTFILVGLGNPGNEYERTRHNTGYLVLEALAKKLNASFKGRDEFQAEVAEANIGEHKAILAKPWTYMNASGRSVQALAHFYKVKPDHVIVISDDVSLPLGTLRVRTEGSAGGHNGLKSIIVNLGTDAFPRVKIGVDAQPENVPLEAWVLSRFSKDEMKILNEVIEQAVEVLQGMIKHGIKVTTVKEL